jgi:UDP-N-acetylglucosamine transferase subunit ALG13
MIYVTVGSSIGGGADFDRLIKKVDEIAPLFEEKFVVQLGVSKYIPRNMKWFDYVPYEKSLEYFQKTRLVIGHCGSGTIINALSFGKPLIVVPRLVRFNENVDDHQLEIARLLESHKLARVVYDVENIELEIRNALDEIDQPRKNMASGHKRQLIAHIRDFLISMKT